MPGKVPTNKDVTIYEVILFLEFFNSFKLLRKKLDYHMSHIT